MSRILDFLRRPLPPHDTLDAPAAFIVPVAAMLVQGTSFGILNSFTTFLDSMKSDTTLGSPSQTSLSFGNSLAVGLSPAIGAIAGTLCDRMGSTLLSFLSLVALSGGLLLASFFADSVASLVLLYGIGAAFSSGLMLSPGAAASSSWFGDRRRSLATGICFAGGGLGSMIVPPLAGMWNDTYGWRGAFQCMAAVCVVGAIASLWVVIRKEDTKNHLNQRISDSSNDRVEEDEEGQKDYLDTAIESSDNENNNNSKTSIGAQKYKTVRTDVGNGGEEAKENDTIRNPQGVGLADLLLIESTPPGSAREPKVASDHTQQKQKKKGTTNRKVKNNYEQQRSSLNRTPERENDLFIEGCHDDDRYLRGNNNNSGLGGTFNHSYHYTMSEMVCDVYFTKRFLAHFLSFLCFSFTFYGFLYLAVPYPAAMGDATRGAAYAHVSPKISNELAATLMTPFGVAQVISSIVFGFLALRYGAVVIHVGCSAITAIALVASCFARSYAFFAVVWVVIGIGTSGVFAVVPSLVAQDFYGPRVGAVIGTVFLAACASGLASGPVIASLQSASDGDYTIGILLMVACQTAAGLMSYSWLQ